MPSHAESCRVAIAGATSLRGRELKQLLEEGSFPASDIHLLDEDIAVGTVTEAAGEPALVRAVDEDSFDRARFVFFTGSPAFAQRHWETAVRAGATVIDLSGGLGDVPSAQAWIPQLDGVLPRPAPPAGKTTGKLYVSPVAAAIAACSVSSALSRYRVGRLAMVFFQPVAERGQAGIEELESQTVKLLSFQPFAQEVFDAQVAFNLMDRYGEGSRERLCDSRAMIARDVRSYLAGRAPVPAIALIHAPVFYSLAFSAYVELSAPPGPQELRRGLEGVGAKLAAAPGDAPTNISVAGESGIVLGQMERDPNVDGGYWFWGAADNLRLVAANAIRIAEKLLAS